MAKVSMLTTFDNPYNPFEDFTSWFLCDVERGYYTCAHLGRIIELSDDMSQKEIDEAIEKAYDQIIKDDFMNVYCKVFADEVESSSV